ncbi:TetR/AcrR family transcriptional regulator [Weissella ceti]|uniref:TetR/AcrR family transcriptional regulator n=1 Tax=Weissella ceti TaxID=759620 RepID=UPI001BD08612|nr:TetR/AcrR family transcriptional regulator [Weissella ceti]QVK12613.1 TetR/AcrR family transcriptional regulator [Weissella ceti]
MVNKALYNLQLDKRNAIHDALIDEFSTYSLDNAHITRITKSANISRASFYTYFEDIFDAYCWILDDYLATVRQMNEENQIKSTIAFLENLTDPVDYSFWRLYYTLNKSLLYTHYQCSDTSPNSISHFKSSSMENLSEWVFRTTLHALIQEYFLSSDKKEDIVANIKKLPTVIKD